MTAFGNIGRATRARRQVPADAWSTPVNGSIASIAKSRQSVLHSPGYLQKSKPTIAVVANIADAFLDDHVALFQYPAAYVQQVKAGSSGAYFYDLDDGTYTAVSTTSEQAWRVVVAGATVTVTALFPPTGGGQAEPMYGGVS